MLSTVQVIGRTTCVVCDSRADSYLCDECSNEPREDIFLLFLTVIKDNQQDFELLRSKCMEISNILDNQSIEDVPQIFFDPRIHSVDNQAQSLLESHTDLEASISKAVDVPADGDCGFNSFQVFYPSMSIEEIRTRVIVELTAHEQFYNSLAAQHGFDLVDDESVQEHVLRILNKGEYVGVLTLSALASIFGRAVDSVYPTINGKHEYIDVLNTSFVPRPTSSISTDQTTDFPLCVLWSGPQAQTGKDWRPNHFVPILFTERVPDSVVEKNDSGPYEMVQNSPSDEANRCPQTSKTITASVETGVSKSSIEWVPARSSPNFLSANEIIQRILHTEKERILDVPPQLVSNSSFYIIKNSVENRSSIGKDGLGVWIQDRSREIPLVLNDQKTYQIVRQTIQGTWYYNKRVGNKYFPQSVAPKDVVLLKR